MLKSKNNDLWKWAIVLDCNNQEGEHLIEKKMKFELSSGDGLTEDGLNNCSLLDIGTF